MTYDQVLDILAQMVRVGFVVSRQPERMRVKVKLMDTTTASLVSDWLPVLCPRAYSDKQYDLPDEGDQVLCVFLSLGLEQGFVLGAMYGKEKPPVTSGDKWHRQFSDGTELEYDRKEHLLTASVKGNVKASVEGNIDITVKGKLGANVQGKASLTSATSIDLNAPAIGMGSNAGGGTTATVTGDTLQRGCITVENGDVTVNNISFLRHRHNCPHGGTTGTPQ